MKRFMVGEVVWFVESNTQAIEAKVIGNQCGRYVVAYNGGNTKFCISGTRLFANSKDAMAAIKRSVPVRQESASSSWRLRRDIPASEPGDGWTRK